MNIRTSLRNIIALLLCLNSVVAIASLDATFNSDVNGNVTSIVPQPDGKLLIAGSFTSVGGVSRNGLARLNPDGSLDNSFSHDLDNAGSVKNIVLQMDGKLVVSGTFNSIGAASRFGIARLNADGSLDDDFLPRFNRETPSFNSLVDSIALQTDGKLVVGGNFTSVDDVSRKYIARLNTDGSLDLAFNPNAADGLDNSNTTVNSLQLQSDGKLLLRGNFSSFGGVPRKRIARLNADGSIDNAFNPNIEGTVFSIVGQSDGKLLIAGTNVLVGFINQGNVTRLNADGSLDTDFNPNNVAGTVFGAVPQADGKLVIFGLFNTVDGVSRNGIARLNADGSLDTNYNPNASDVTIGSLLVLQNDGKLLLGRGITGVKRLNADGDPQTQNLVNLSVSSTAGLESDVTVITVTASASQAVVGNQTVDIGISGEGITNTDYLLSNSTITFLDAATSGSVTFTVRDDADIEGLETATLSLINPSSGVVLGEVLSQNITITDNDFPSVVLSVSSNTGSESAGSVITVNAIASQPVVGNQSVSIGVSGTGITITDYLLSNAIITILDGAMSGRVTFTILRDLDVEGNETASLSINSRSAGLALSAMLSQDIVISDSNYDFDNDTILNIDDNCPNMANADQADLDGDGIGDVCDADIDGDGMSNEFEVANGLDPRNPSDRDADADGDGFTNGEEARFGTDPNMADIDENNNGVPDAADGRKSIITPILLLLLLDEKL